MKKVFCLLLILFLVPVAAVADVLTDTWKDASLDELLAAQIELNNEISGRRAAEINNAGKIELSGKGTDILSDINISVSPVRVTFASDGEAKLTMSGSKYDHVYHNSEKGTTVELLDDVANYSALVESTGAWSLTIEPIVPGQTLPFAGTGDAVSNFFEVTAPMIVTVSWDASESTAWINSLYVRLCHQYSNISAWQNDSLVSEFPLEKTGSLDVILKPTKGRTEYCLSVDTSDDVKWTIEPKK